MQVLIWKSKYSDSIYDASTPEKLERASREILSQLVNDNWLYCPDPVELDEEEHELLAMTKEQLEALPESVRKDIIQKRRSIRRRVAETDSEIRDYEETLKIVAGETVMFCVRLRSKYSDDEWAEILEAARTKWKFSYDIREDGIYRERSAWSVLQDRNGAEYEHYELENVITFDD